MNDAILSLAEFGANAGRTIPPALGRRDDGVRDLHMQRTVPQVAFELPSSVGAPMQARRRCERLCRDWDLESLRSDCSLLVSELVTNAVLHGTGPIVLEIDRDDRVLRVTVANESAVGSVSPSPRDASTVEESGRGLAIVGAVAAKWGTHRDEAGTRVWFELRA